MRGRPLVTSYVYGDEGRILRTITWGEWTDEDRALMLALEVYRSTLCPGCHHPKATAWHPDNEGWFDPEDDEQPTTCWACTSTGQLDPDGNRIPVQYATVRDHRDYTAKPLPSPAAANPAS